MTDIERVCLAPTDEDRAWFPDIAGNGDAIGTLKEAWANYRDESFLQQFLSPAVMRQFKLFRLRDDADKPYLLVDAIHNQEGYRDIRRSVARSYDPSTYYVDIEIVDVDMTGDRCLQAAAPHDARPSARRKGRARLAAPARRPLGLRGQAARDRQPRPRACSPPTWPRRRVPRAERIDVAMTDRDLCNVFSNDVAANGRRPQFGGLAHERVDSLSMADNGLPLLAEIFLNDVPQFAGREAFPDDGFLARHPLS